MAEQRQRVTVKREESLANAAVDLVRKLEDELDQAREELKASNETLEHLATFVKENVLPRLKRKCKGRNAT